MSNEKQFLCVCELNSRHRNRNKKFTEFTILCEKLFLKEFPFFLKKASKLSKNIGKMVQIYFIQFVCALEKMVAEIDMSINYNKTIEWKRRKENYFSYDWHHELPFTFFVSFSSPSSNRHRLHNLHSGVVSPPSQYFIDFTYVDTIFHFFHSDAFTTTTNYHQTTTSINKEMR